MAEVLTLTTPVTPPAITTWQVREIHISPEEIAVLLVSNLGQPFTWVSATPAQAKTLAGFINQGKFMTVQSKSLHRWIIDQLVAAGTLPSGTVTGTVE